MVESIATAAKIRKTFEIFIILSFCDMIYRGVKRCAISRDEIAQPVSIRYFIIQSKSMNYLWEDGGIFILF
jgi:hypothetical protein